MIKHIQVDFLQQIAHKIGADKILAVELSSVLGISKSEAYGKANGSSLLTTTQILQLCDTYGIDFNIVREKGKSSAKVSFIPFHAIEYTVHDYIQSLESFLVKMSQAKHKKIICATNDIPLFHLFKYPELAAFKLHFWNLRIANHSTAEFDFAGFDHSVLKTAEHLYQLYKNIPSTEIWTNHLSLNSIEQLKYAAENDLFTNKETGKIVCAQLISTIKDIEAYAVNGNKADDSESAFEWYFYDIIGGITYLAEADGNRSAFIRFNTFNNLQAENGPLCDEVTDWLNNMIADSTGFSKQGSTQRNRYIKKLVESCDMLSKMFD
ncbi:MAG: hypothetical protein K2Q24_07855 [Chitinophagaceae bacterium]|jgi:hypothetical protein|nr:hypothetical protein [Chitinophagaceae bacterium]